MDRDYRKIIQDTENMSDKLLEDARQSAREAEKKAATEASVIKETGIRKAREKAQKIVSDSEERAGKMISESKDSWNDDVNRLKKATWATSEEAASVIVGKVINL